MDPRPGHSGDFLIESDTSLQAESSTLAGLGPRSLAAALDLVILLVPASRNVAAVAPLIQSVESQVEPPFGLVFVHDADDAAIHDVATEFAKSRPWFDIVANSEGTGYGGALRTGFRVIAHGPVVVLSPDAADDTNGVGRMRRLYAEGHPVVSGSRDMRGGHRRGGSYLSQRLGRMANRVIRRAGRMPLADPTSSFRLYDAALVNELGIDGRHENEIAVEVAAKALAQGVSIIEFPTSWRDRSEAGAWQEALLGARRTWRWCRHARRSCPEPQITPLSAELKPLADSHSKPDSSATDD